MRGDATAFKVTYHVTNISAAPAVFAKNEQLAESISKFVAKLSSQLGDQPQIPVPPVTKVTVG